ncbi:MAG TPA: 2-dehydropantoate 2-reductase N-terminal domain-containing protein [Coleofasciculaceae cyanobacterium]|jgi:ketopantoate reductase
MDNILVIGAGSVGALLGASLVKANLKITFASKPGSNYTHQLQEQGLKIHYANGEKLWISPSNPQVRFLDTATYLVEKFDLIIVAIKSNHLHDVVSYIQAHSNSNTILIHAQNGIPYWWFDDDSYLNLLSQNLFNKLSSRPYLDSVDQNGYLYKNLSKFTLAGCVVKAPCRRTAQAEIEVRKPPQLILGLTKNGNCNSKQQIIVKHLCELFSHHGVTATYTSEIRAAVCNKLAINVTTNVLSALTGKVIADLTTNSHTNSLIKTVIAEVNYIFVRYGIKPEDLPTEQKIYAYIKTPGSQSHLPSLAQDFSQHKPGEVSLITALVEMAKIAQLKVPTLYSLSELLQLCQTYSLKSSNGKSHILTLDHSSGYCTLTNDVCQSSLVNKWQISNLLTHLVQVNVSALIS